MRSKLEALLFIGMVAAVGNFGQIAVAASASPVVSVVGPLNEGDVAPLFTARGDDHRLYSLAELKGKYVVLYFYPKDDTQGCTIEAKSFRDDAEKLTRKGVIVLGVSLDDAVSHKAFRAKYGLNFPLLTSGAELAGLYRVPLRGGYAARETFVIDPGGRIVKHFTHVNPVGHADEVLSVIP